ncbi:uncharacterized protein N7529_002885 [Penicillium soppii]|uniref:uncharacterized protein n=1 Tax=Penicillium soppii TaxID=69789 RepID=UPI0025489379|nr:uncharacterized protein N7529_002885 [Penicillium soppii]KAJ5874455.1 hypothetical protein N7529_002885 [Penicillium soppii]
MSMTPGSTFSFLTFCQTEADSSAIPFECVRYRCKKSDNPIKFAYVPIYKQFPRFNTEVEDSSIRASQVTRWVPPELAAYKTLTNTKATPRLSGWSVEKQKSSRLIRGGFIVSLAWEEVPGIQLGDCFSGDVFWSLSHKNETLSARL